MLTINSSLLFSELLDIMLSSFMS